MAPFLKAMYLFGLGIDGIAGAIMLDVSDNALFDLFLVTMAPIAVADVPDGKHLVDVVSGEERARGETVAPMRALAVVGQVAIGEFRDVDPRAFGPAQPHPQ